jgi:hypothetical protein
LIASTILEDIRTDPFLNYLYGKVIAFDKYLESTSRCTFTMKGLRCSKDYLGDNNVDAIEYEFEYIHRWTKKYDNKILCRLYNLEWYFHLHLDQTPKYTMMITLTGIHATPRNPRKGGLNHMAYLEKFYNAHSKSKDLLRKYLETNQYLAMLEGHPESGYVHAHDLYFLNELPSEKTLKTVENHWNKTLRMGSAEHGIKVEIKEPRDFNDIKSFIAYPMSYIGKTTIGNLPEWSKYDVIFNTCLWLSPRPKLCGGIGHRVRAFQPSRALSKIMNPKLSKDEYIHIETSLSHKNQNDETLLYQAPSYDMNMKAWLQLGGDEPAIQAEENLCELHQF